MDKEQQIEEMKKVMCEEYGKECNYCPCSDCANAMIAENLYNAGYRKTFTSDLASDNQKAFKEGYIKGFDDRDEEFKIIIGRNEQLLKRNAQLEEKLSEFKKPIDKFIKDREKQTVKEFAEKLKMKAFNKDMFNDWAGATYVVLVREIDKLLKEYEKCDK